MEGKARCDADRSRRWSWLPPSPGAEDVCGGLTAAEACLAALGTRRVGEATNPGHRLTWISDRAASALRYAMPGKAGFYGVQAAGFQRDDDGPPQEPFALRILTANTTGWRPLRGLLATTNASVVFAQEHRLFEGAIPAASAWARRNGWKSIWTPAASGPNGGASAGTVILVRDFIGMRHPECGSHEVERARIAAAIIEPPACRPFLGYSAYFHDGQGLSRPNLALAAAIGSHWQSQGDPSLQFVVAADFNMEPATFARAGLSSKLHGRLVAPSTLRGTCRTRAKNTTYDFFFMSTPMADMVAEVNTVEGTGVKTHAPTAALFHPRLTTLKALALRMPPSIHREAVYGPRPPPPPWEGITAAINKLVHFVKGGGEHNQADDLLSDLYGLWVDYAEEELADITGTALPRTGKRSGGPQLVWKSVLPEVRRAPPPSGASSLAWLADITRDAIRLSAPPSREDDIRGHVLINILREALEEEVMGKDWLVADGSVDRVYNILCSAEALVDDDAAPVDSRWIAWTAEAEATLADLRSRHVKAAAVESNDSLKEWREWLRAGFERGAKHAHAYMRLPAEWRPSQATSPEGLPTAQPSAVLNGQRVKYGRAWEANEDVGRYNWPDRQSLPRLTPTELREAS